MEQYIIKGGHPLVGEVEIGGAKNAALAILAAGIMTDDTVRIDNLPDVNDINVLLDAIAGIGASVHRIDRHTVSINGKGIRDLRLYKKDPRVILPAWRTAWKIQARRGGASGRLQYRKQANRSAFKRFPGVGCGC